jgi:hypothetical protein
VTVLLITGSRALHDRGGAAAERWCRGILGAAVATHAPTRVVAGDARGPDAWAEAAARDGGVLFVRFDLAGKVVRDSVYLGHWEREAPPPVGSAARKRWPLRRNTAMVLSAIRYGREHGCPVRCLALPAPAGWSRTHGTAHTVGLCERAGIPVETFRYDPKEHA